MKQIENKKASNPSGLNTNENKVIFAGMTILIVVFGILGGWMALAPLNSAAVAPGKVTVQNNKKIVQHLEGGIIEKIHVKDGDQVKKDDLLIEIQDVRLKSKIDINHDQYIEARILQSRLLAERDELESIVFHEDVQKNAQEHMDAINAQIAIFKTRKQLREDEKDIFQKRIVQLNKQILGIQSLIDSRISRKKSIDEEIAEWQRLFEEQLTDKIKLRELQRQQVEIQGEIANQEAEIAKIEVQITETESNIFVNERTFKEEVLSELSSVQQTIQDNRSENRSLMDQLARTQVRAPVSGAVVGMKFHTIGGVIRAGEEVLSIVPDTSDLVVKAQMQTTDIDKVHLGLMADVRFSAFKLQMVQVVEGKVIHISADSFENEQSGIPYYEIKVKVTEAGKKQLKDNEFFLLPGMPAEVMVKTGERTVLSYLVNPFVNMFSRAFKED